MDSTLIYKAFERWRRTSDRDREAEWMDYCCLRDGKNYRTSSDIVGRLTEKEYESIKKRVLGENTYLPYKT